MKEFFKQYFFLLDQRAKKQLPFLILLFLFSSLLDVIGIGLIGVFLALISNPGHYLQRIAQLPVLRLLDPTQQSLGFIEGIGTVIIIAFVFKAFMGCLIQKKSTAFSYRFALRLKMRLLNAYQYAPYAFHLKQNSAYLVNRFTQVDIYTSGVLLPSLTLASNLLIAFFVLGFLLIVHPFATLGLAMIFIFIIGLNNKTLKLKVQSLGKICASAGGEIIKNLHHGLGGLKEIRVLGTEKYFFKKIEDVADDYADALSVNAAYQLIPRYVLESVLAIFVIVLCLSSLISGASPAATVAFVGVFAAAGVRLLPTMTQLTAGLNQIRFAAPNMEKIAEELQELIELEINKIPEACIEKMPFTKIVLQNIHYQYPHAKQGVLNDVTLTITKGQSIGLIGTSGAGKSTIVNVLLGLLTPNTGQILVDGHPILNMRTWLNNFAYIPQHVFLLDDTLKRNIALGVDDDALDEPKMKKAIQMAQLVSVVEELPLGVETIVGENGFRLSGGQRQRVALARAFYHERDIIVMDEATAALDHETEKEVIDAIKQLHGVKTLIVIAHRLTTVEYCDVVCRMEKGKIINTGSFQEVIGNKRV